MTGPAAGAGAPVEFTVYMRSYCHLCDELVADLQRMTAGRPVAIRQVDVDADPALEALHGDKVPVLFGGTRELCHYRLDVAAVAAYLSGIN